MKVHKVFKGNRVWLCLLLYNFITFTSPAQSWAPVGSGISGSDANTTWTLCPYDSVLYAGGYFNSAGGVAVNNIAQWNGTQWDSLGIGTDGFINAMAVYKGNLYAGGLFTHIGGIAASDVAMWNGSAWMPVGAGLKGGDYGVYAMTVFNGSLYVGGNFDSSGTKAIYAIAQWNDTTWSAVGAGGIYSTDEDDAVFALAVYKGGLYVAGDVGTTGGTNIAEWTGGSWTSVGGGTVGFIFSLAVYDDKLYAGGNMTQAGATQVSCIGSWNGTTWSSPDTGIWGENGWAIVNALAVYNGALYVGGYFDSVNGQQINCIAKWNGTQWSPVGSGIVIGGSVDAITVFDTSLFIGGGFDSAGGVYAENIAMFSTPSSINELRTKSEELRVYPNPATTQLSIEIKPFNKVAFYSVFNELGQQVETGRLNTSKSTTIDISAYSSGVYMVAVSDGTGHYMAKFIKY